MHVAVGLLLGANIFDPPPPPVSISGAAIVGDEGDMSSLYSYRGTTCFMFLPPKKKNHQSVHAIQQPNQFPFNTTAKVAPKMYKNSQLFELKNPNSFLERGKNPLPRPLSAPSAPQSSRLRRSTLAPSALVPHLQHKWPPLVHVAQRSMPEEFMDSHVRAVAA